MTATCQQGKIEQVYIKSKFAPLGLLFGNKWGYNTPKSITIFI